MTIELEQVRKMLLIHKHRLDDELEIQPDLMMRISSEVVKHNSRQLEYKDELSRVEARLVEDLREDDPKMTVAMVSAKISRNSERMAAWHKYQAERAEHEKWSHMLDAWRQKGYSIKTLADLYSAQYFSVDSTKLSDRQQSRLNEGDDARAAMRKASSRVTEAASDTPKPTRRSVL